MGFVDVDVQQSKALQQPEWDDQRRLEQVRVLLASCAPLVSIEDADTLQRRLAGVAAGAAFALQAGDCAEDPAAISPAHVLRKTTALHELAAALGASAGRPVVRAGRIAGQFAKPRSSSVERIGDVELPSYRGHMVNRPEFDAESRRADPLRLLTGYMAAKEITMRLGWRGHAGRQPGEDAELAVWTSHEALLLDYELPMIRRHDDGRLWLGSTHWPWLGERTRQPDGPHVAMLAEISNPVGCKVGPRAQVDDIVEICERLDPHREPGRLSLIARMGAGSIAERLPVLVETVRSNGHPVIWLCDPMHGNTVTTSAGIKIRRLGDILAEVRGFRRAFAALGAVPGGLHLEMTPDQVAECAEDRRTERPPGAFTSLCDPRLNLEQAAAVISAWSEFD